MVEVAVGIMLAVAILVYFGEMHAFAAALFGCILVPTSIALVYYLRLQPLEIAAGIVVAAVVLGSILREASADREQEGRRT